MKRRDGTPTLYSVNGQALEVVGVVTIEIELLPEKTQHIDVMAIAGIGPEIILGTDWMSQENVTLDFERRS